MRVEIPVEFEAFAREQVVAGHVASEEEAVANAFRNYPDDVKALREPIAETATMVKSSKPLS